MREDPLPFPQEARDERPPAFPPPLTLEGQCTACGCRWAKCGDCGLWWYGCHSCPGEGEPD